MDIENIYYLDDGGGGLSTEIKKTFFLFLNNVSYAYILKKRSDVYLFKKHLIAPLFQKMGLNNYLATVNEYSVNNLLQHLK